MKIYNRGVGEIVIMKLNRLSAGAVACFTVACALVGSKEANADPYVVTIEQVGANVIATGSGAIDLSGLSIQFSASTNSVGVIPSVPQIITAQPGTSSYDAYGFATGPTTFGSGGYTPASSGSGDLVGVDGSYILVPVGYVSFASLSDGATFDNATFLTLGITPGTYTWTWGSGVDQNFTIDAIETVATPLPAALPLFATGLGALGLLGWRRKRKAAALAA
jgi:hypothetical protein